MPKIDNIRFNLKCINQLWRFQIITKKFLIDTIKQQISNMSNKLINILIRKNYQKTMFWIISISYKNMITIQNVYIIGFKMIRKENVKMIFVSMDKIEKIINLI